MSKTAAIPMDKEIQSFLFTFTGQQYKTEALLAENATGRQQQKGNEHAAKNHYASLP